MSRSCMESHPSSKSVDGEAAWVSASAMKLRSKSISPIRSDMSISLDLGSNILSKIGPELLTTLSLMDSLSSRNGELLRSSRSNTTTVRKATFSLWISICRWLDNSLDLIYGSSLSSLLSSGTTVTQATRPALDFVTQLRTAQHLRLECIYADQTG